MVGSEPAQAWRSGQAAVEKGVEVRHQQKTVEDVQALDLGFHADWVESGNFSGNLLGKSFCRLVRKRIIQLRSPVD